MKKSTITIILLTLLLVLSSCSSGNNARKNGLEIDSFNGGSDALVFEFGKEAPPQKVRDQGLQPFSIRILVSNEGETDIIENSAHITLTGFNPLDLNLNETSKPLNLLRGIKKQGNNIIPGGKQQVVFSDLRYTNSAVSGSFPLTIYANICYPYETKALTIICINGDTVPAIDKKAEICSLEGNKKYSNSGAPIQIENVKEYPYGSHSVQIQFDIVHNPTSENSNVYERGSLDSNCNVLGKSPSSSEALFKRDKVTYVVESGIPGLNCESTGKNTNTITLTNNRYTVTCIQDTKGQNEYEKPISITLKYDYLDRKSKTITIEHIQR